MGLQDSQCIQINQKRIRCEIWRNQSKWKKKRVIVHFEAFPSIFVAAFDAFNTCERANSASKRKGLIVNIRSELLEVAPRQRLLLIQRAEKCLQTIDDELILFFFLSLSSLHILFISHKSLVVVCLAHHSIQYRVKKREENEIEKHVTHTKLNIAWHSNQFVRIWNWRDKITAAFAVFPRAKIYLFTSSHISSERFYSDCLLTSTANWHSRKKKWVKYWRKKEKKKATAKPNARCRFQFFRLFSLSLVNDCQVSWSASAIKPLKCINWILVNPHICASLSK